MGAKLRNSFHLFLQSSQSYFAFFASFFILLFLLPILTQTNSFEEENIFQSPQSKLRVQLASCIEIGISFPLVLDGVLDLSIKNLLKRWIYWGMLSSIIIPSVLNLIASFLNLSSLYVFSAILGLQLRYVFLVINTLATDFSSFFKSLLLIIASIRVVLLFIWSIALFQDYHHQYFNRSCQILIFICDVLMVGLLIHIFRLVKETDPAKLCLKVYSIVLVMLLTINLGTFLSDPSLLFSQLLHPSDASAIISVLKACTIAIATVMPNRIYRASAEEENRRFARKRDFVRYVSHEVRTPLNAVYVGLHVLFQDIKSVTNNLDILTVVEDIKMSCNEAVNILDGILHFNEIEEGVAKLKPSLVKLKPFMSRLVHPFFQEATRMNLTLKYQDEIDNDDADPHYLFLDKLKFGMVMRSIIASSLHMTSENGTVEVSLSLVSEYADPPDDRPHRNGHQPASDLSHDRDHGTMMRVIVRDTGAGIPKASLAAIFDDTTQFRPIDYQSGLGSALDLWIAKKYIEMHGGRIGIVSSGEIGDGCIFYIDLKITQRHELDALSSNADSAPSFSSNDLQNMDSNEPLTSMAVQPIVDEDSKLTVATTSPPSNSGVSIFSMSLPTISPKFTTPNQQTPSNNPQPTQPPPPSKYSMKVIPGDSIIEEGQKLSRALVVDDVASNRKMLGRVIQSRFYQIDYAENGQIAVDLVKESEENEGATRFNVIFMDCNMPVMDGIEATKRIRALGFRGRMYGVTGNALGEDMDEFLASGLDKVLTKPLNMEKLIQAMKDVDNRQNNSHGQLTVPEIHV